MRKIIILFVMLILSLMFATTVYSQSWCYQETANVSTICGGLDTGTYSYSGGNWIGTPSDAWDGNWSTYVDNIASNEYIYVNYTKPSNSSYGTLIQFKHAQTPITRNESINSTCWNGIEDKVVLRFSMEQTGFDHTFHVECSNGSSWYNIFLDDNGTGQSYMYEEAMWWNMSNNMSDTCTPPASGNYNVDCSDSCSWSSTDDIPGNVTMTGSGTVQLSNAWTFNGTDQYISVGSGCTFEIVSGGSIG